MNYIMVSSVNGEGYSEPGIKIVNDVNKNKLMAEEVSNFDGNVRPISDLRTEIDYNYYKDTDTYADNGMVELIPIPTLINGIEYHIIMVQPDICDTSLEFSGIATIQHAKDLLNKLVTGKIHNYNFDPDDVAEHDEDNCSFGSHEEGTGYIHFEIVRGSELNKEYEQKLQEIQS